MRIRRVAGTVIAAFAVALLLPSVAEAAPTITVTPQHQMGWSTADTRPGGDVNFITDSTAPAGNGALQLTTDATTAAKAQYMHNTLFPLAWVTSLSYYTKQNLVVQPPVADPSYQLGVYLDARDSSSFTTLVYEPYWNGVVTPGVWQNWDVDSGNFWSSRTYTGSGTCAVVAGSGGPPFYTLAALQAACPRAVVTAFGVNVGTYNPGYDVETDLFNFNGFVYDFEPGRPSCRPAGWWDNSCGGGQND